MTSKEKVSALRRLMRKEGLTAYLVPTTDPHQSEYVPTCWRRREFLSGFTGSAGDLVITQKEAGLWTDSRYWLQAERELDKKVFKLFKAGEPGVPSINAYLGQKVRKGQRVGIDPRVISKERAEELEFVLKGRDAALKLVPNNLVDAIWADTQPPLPGDQVQRLADRYAGQKVEKKLAAIREELSRQDLEAHLICALDAIAWTFNLRGRDVEFNPVAIAYALVTRRGATLFIDEAKLSAATIKWLRGFAKIEPYEAVGKALRRLAKDRRRVLIDPKEINRWALDRLRGARLVFEDSPVQLAKSSKNKAELRGMRHAHVQDGVALVRFLSWLESVPQRGRLSEVDCIDRLEGLRAEGELYQGASFAYISSWKANGAVIHYDPTKAKPAKLKGRGLYLFDTGGQYLTGTTDVTRTIVFGDPTDYEKACFTRVLQGVIALSVAHFPEGTFGATMEALARRPLWGDHLNYKHGTGHGVGHYLNVHEGPVGFAPKNPGKLKAGNVLTIEPGHYEAGKFGIRIENMVAATPVGKQRPKDGEPAWLAFETLTLCPIDLRLIDPRLMTAEEVKWLNGYHEWVRDTLAPHLDSDDRAYLELATRPL